MAIRTEYEKEGVEGYYKKQAATYSNPHMPIIEELLKMVHTYDLKVLDLCCGTGEVTKGICNAREVVGLDPFLHTVYVERTGNICYDLDFKAIAQGELTEKFDLIICSFALHLCEESLLPNVLWNLGLISDRLIILTPNKRPDCGIMGWKLKEEVMLHRVRMREYER